MQNQLDPDRAAVAHILTTPLIAARTAPYLVGGETDFDGLAVEAETMSSGQALLVQIASDLWSAERHVGVVDLVRRLDAGNFLRVVEAMRIARSGLIWDMLETRGYAKNLAA
jgi:hypothetical protein